MTNIDEIKDFPMASKMLEETLYCRIADLCPEEWESVTAYIKSAVKNWNNFTVFPARLSRCICELLTIKGYEIEVKEIPSTHEISTIIDWSGKYGKY